MKKIYAGYTLEALSNVEYNEEAAKVMLILQKNMDNYDVMTISAGTYAVFEVPF